MRRTFPWSKCIAFVVCINISVWILLTLLLERQKPSSEVRVVYSKSGLLSDDSQYRLQVQRHLRSDANNANVNLTQVSILAITAKIKSVARLIYNAKKHVRGSKTFDLLKKATDTMSKLLTVMGINSSQLYERTTYVSRSVCPEKYMGTLFGAPFFYEGFKTTGCSIFIPIWKIVTIIKVFKLQENDKQVNENKLETFVSSAYQIHSNFNIFIGLDVSQLSYDIKTKYPKLNLIDLKGKPEGNVINDLVDKVKTPYVLIARNVEFLTHDMGLERLIREIEQLGVTVAGGAFRNAEGHWKKGCFQSVFKNFTLKYLEGYDESLHECLFCDFVQGPFVTKKDYLIQNSFYHLNENEGLFEDWFLRNFQSSKESVICPDSMFHIHAQNKQETNWNTFMKKWNIFRCVTPMGDSIVKECSSFIYDVSPSKIVPLCSLQYNADAIKIIMNVCEEEGIVCELQEGTALGAVKLGKTLPWERDIDLTFLTANYTALQKLRNYFEDYYFAFTDFDKRWCCVDNTTAGGQFRMRFKGWNIELNGQHKMDSELLIKEGIKPTKTMLDGKWVNVPRNPGLFVRNRYGREIYQHAEHWITTGDKSGWIDYKTNVFQPCTSPGDHDCLDRYNADGDLPFIDVLP